MRINEYVSASKLTEEDVFVVDGTDGTRKIKSGDALFAMLNLYSPYNRRMVFRGKNLGSSVSVSQKNAIQNGTFENLCLGDYWQIGGVKYRIVDFDYWYGKGDAEFATHHVVVMPDSNLGTAKMNSTAVTTGAYVGSEMYKANLTSAKSQISSAFGSNLLSHREYLTNAMTGGYPSAGAWMDSTVELPNELMIFGTSFYSPSGNGSMTVKRYTASTTQLALFALCPKFIMKPDDAAARISYWLRDPVNTTSFVRVSSYGAPQDTSASAEWGIRPVFAVG